MNRRNHPFIPNDFQIPEKMENPHFRIRMLTIKDVEKDYDAVMSSIDHLKGVFGPDSTWPDKDLSIEQDLIDLGWHQKEFQRRSSFTYTVMAVDESECLGCVYIYPSLPSGYDAEVYLWVRKSAYVEGLDQVLYDAVKQWLVTSWPFDKIAYPGREIGWHDWEKIKNSDTINW